MSIERGIIPGALAEKLTNAKFTFGTHGDSTVVIIRDGTTIEQAFDRKDGRTDFIFLGKTIAETIISDYQKSAGLITSKIGIIYTLG